MEMKLVLTQLFRFWNMLQHNIVYTIPLSLFMLCLFSMIRYTSHFVVTNCLMGELWFQKTLISLSFSLYILLCLLYRGGMTSAVIPPSLTIQPYYVKAILVFMVYKSMEHKDGIHDCSPFTDQRSKSTDCNFIILTMCLYNVARQAKSTNKVLDQAPQKYSQPICTLKL